MISTVITYSALSMEQITQAAETVEVKQTTNFEKTTEEFEVLSIGNVNNKFNMTVSNTGDIPVHLTRLWVENTTDSTWPIAKYDIDEIIPSGGSVYNIGQNIGLTALDTQSYEMKLVSERGNTEKMLLNSVGEESLHLNLRATPTIISTGFSSTLVLEVINTGSNKLVNLQAEIDSVDKSCASCSYDVVSGPSPTSFDSLNPGDIAIFEWVYTVDGTTDGDNLEFTASLVNGVDEATAVVTIKVVEVALNSSVSFEAGGVDSDIVIDESILLFHMEQDLVPSPGYQMFSSESDGGSTGLRIDMETKTAALGAFSLFTNNGSDTITIPAGNWNASLALRSEAVATGIQDQNEDMIFHFEDGDGVDPDNSEGDANRDLQTCGADEAVLHEDTVVTNVGSATNPVTINLSAASAGDLRIVTLTGTDDWASPMHSITIPPGWTEINDDQSYGDWSAIRAATFYRVVQGGDGNTVAVTFGSSSGATAISNTYSGINTSNPIDVEETSYATRYGTDPTSRAVATTTANTMVVRTFHQDDNGEDNSPQIVPSGLTQRGYGEISGPGNGAVVSWGELVQAGIGSTGTAQWDTEENNEHNMVQTFAIRASPTGDPDWQPGEGPHNSGAYYYDGVDECNQSKYDVSNSNGNHIDNNDVTTSLWFKTDGVGQVSSEQMLVFWEGNGVYPNSDYYKISIGDGVDGTILFEYDVELGTETSTCQSTDEYDDGQWHHVVAVKTASDDGCELYITDINGDDEETIAPTPPNHSGSVIDADGKWYVASREDNGNYFKGWIDDVMHWNNDALDSTEADLLSHTNYGDTAHQFEVNLDVTDTDGNFVSNMFSDSAYAIPFYDAKSQADTVDAAYTMFNVTMSLPQIQVTTAQRLNFSTAFVPSTSTWEALELDMKIDDDDFTLPSYLQIPTPDNPFPNYLRYDKSEELTLYVNNNGEDGIYFVYSGTRASFDDGTKSYASQIHYVNGTSAPFEVDVDTDSIYIPSGEKAELHFYANPTDHPCQANGQSCSNANIVPDGTYRLASWINGYTDQGESFGRSVLIGNVIVED